MCHSAHYFFRVAQNIAQAGHAWDADSSVLRRYICIAVTRTALLSLAWLEEYEPTLPVPLAVSREDVCR